MYRFASSRSFAGSSIKWRRLLAAAAALLAAPALAIAAPTAPPPVTILTSSPFVGPGYFFISPYGDQTTYANGPEILDRNGKAVWFKAVPEGEEASDFRVQSYRGKPVLTWWQGTGLGSLSSGIDYIYNENYEQIAKVKAGNGFSADGHEFLITPWDTALILAYTSATADLRSLGGPANQTVINGVVQEIDIATGKVLFQWKSEDHVPFSESQQPLPATASSAWDWFHVNAVKLDTDGNLLIDARDTWTTYKVSRANGNIIWRLGGKHSNFKLRAAFGQTLDNAGELFTWQHDPQALGGGIYTFFDNESAGAGNTGTGSTSEFGFSRAITVKLDEWNYTATLIRSDNQPEGQIAPSQGNAQTTDLGNLVVGWGSLPYFSVFSPWGQLVYNAQFPTGVNTYRAYLLPWNPGRQESGFH